MMGSPVSTLDIQKVCVYSVIMANRKSNYSIMYNFWINPELLNRIDHLRKVMSERDGLPYERSPVVRMLLARAVRDMEQELGIV